MRNNKHPGMRQAQLIEEALQKGLAIVIDNTNPRVEDREPLIRLGRMYGAEITGYYFESQVRKCLERNRLREGKARVPDVAIYVTVSKLVRPLYKEGSKLGPVGNGKGTKRWCSRILALAFLPYVVSYNDCSGWCERIRFQKSW